MNTLELTNEELEFLVNHIITFARIEGVDPVWAEERKHAAIVGSLMRQTPEAMLLKILEEEMKGYSKEQIERMIQEAKS